MQKWFKDFPKEVPAFQNWTSIHGQYHLYRDKRVCVKPLRSRIEATQKLQPPTTIKGCRSFMGIVNFCEHICPVLQKLLKPIYNLTWKGRQFIWGEEWQKAFEKIKGRLQRPPFCIYQIDKEISAIFWHKQICQG